MTTISKHLPVVVTEPADLAPATLSQLQRIGPVTLGPFDRPALLKAVEPSAVLMIRLGHMIDQEVLAAAPSLQAIVSATTGLNHIDLGACKSRGIEIICTRGERAFLSTITGTAELALALLLGISRHLVPAHEDVLSGRWRRDEFRGVSLRGLTLGVIGLGRLGCLMAGYGQALGMRILATDPAPAGIPPGIQMTLLEELLRESDAVSLHATHDEGDSPILGVPEISSMKRGLVLVNTARGELVNESALLQGLESGQIGGYATDVLADETKQGDLRDNPLVRYAASHRNVIITPHIGGATLDGLVRTEEFVVAKLLAHLGLDVPVS